MGIAGKVGSGKSALLGAILEEMPFYSGFVGKSGSIGYVEQEPVVLSTTIKLNILFGRDFDERSYSKVLERSCLLQDLKLFVNLDETIVGERGITLSGGQKARLVLARALYADADIFLFDDPISAVDSKVAKQIFSNVMMDLRGRKTMVLVTHQISYLEMCDQVLIMEGGRILHNDHPRRLRAELEELKDNRREGELEERGA